MNGFRCGFGSLKLKKKLLVGSIWDIGGKLGGAAMTQPTLRDSTSEAAVDVAEVLSRSR